MCRKTAFLPAFIKVFYVLNSKHENYVHPDWHKIISNVMVPVFYHSCHSKLIDRLHASIYSLVFEFVCML
jgi:hypothetical protein